MYRYILLHRQQYRCAWCIPFHRRLYRYGRAGCIHLRRLQYRVDLQGVPILFQLLSIFFNAGLNGIRSVYELKCRCREQFCSAGIRGPRPTPECPGNGLRCGFLKCRWLCRLCLHHTRGRLGNPLLSQGASISSYLPPFFKSPVFLDERKSFCNGGFIKGILRGVRCTKSLRVLFLHRRPPQVGSYALSPLFCTG